MAQIIALYKAPADTVAFQNYYHQTHVPIAKKIPGLRSLSISDGAIEVMAGEVPYLIGTLTFDSMADLHAALASPEGQATADDLKNFASGGVTLLMFESKAV